MFTASLCFTSWSCTFRLQSPRPKPSSAPGNIRRYPWGRIHGGGAVTGILGGPLVPLAVTGSRPFKEKGRVWGLILSTWTQTMGRAIVHLGVNKLGLSHPTARCSFPGRPISTKGASPHIQGTACGKGGRLPRTAAPLHHCPSSVSGSGIPPS